MKALLALILGLSALGCAAQTNRVATNQAAGLKVGQGSNTVPLDVQAELIRKECVAHRRFICGRVMQIVPGGLVVESGYISLLNPAPPSWVVPGNVSATREPNAVEAISPDAVCLGLVFITDIPRRPTVNRYDYVVLHGYPAGEYEYTPVPGIHKVIRRFAAGVERAVALNLEDQQKKH